MSKIHIIIPFILLPFLSYADWYEIKTHGKVVPFGKMAEIGKVSVFILGTSWCGPCKGLKERLKHESGFDMDKVDCYYIEFADYKDKNSKGYNVWTSIEEVQVYPTIYILSQATNIVSKFDADEKQYYEKTIRIVNSLLKDEAMFDKTVMFDYLKYKKSDDSERPAIASKNTDTENDVIAVSNTAKPNDRALFQKQSFTIKLAVCKGEPTISTLQGIDSDLYKVVTDENSKKKVLYYGVFETKKDANNILKKLKRYYKDASIVSNKE